MLHNHFLLIIRYHLSLGTRVSRGSADFFLLLINLKETFSFINHFSKFSYLKYWVTWKNKRDHNRDRPYLCSI